MAFVVFILGVMLLIPGIQVSVYAIPVWLLVMWACYRLQGSPAADAGPAGEAGHRVIDGAPARRGEGSAPCVSRRPTRLFLGAPVVDAAGAELT